MGISLPSLLGKAMSLCSQVFRVMKGFHVQQQSAFILSQANGIETLSAESPVCVCDTPLGSCTTDPLHYEQPDTFRASTPKERCRPKSERKLLLEGWLSPRKLQFLHNNYNVR